MTANSTGTTGQSTPAALPGNPAPVRNRTNMLRLLAPTARDIAVPLAAYFALHWAGYSDFAALLAGAVVSGAMVIYQVIKARRIDALSAIILVGFAFGLIASFISGDARMMIVRDSLSTAAIGLAFLISALIGKPLTYAASLKAFATSDPAKAAAMAESYRTVPGVRKVHLALASVWGVGLLAEAGARVVLAYQLPVHTMAWLSTVLMVGTFGVLFLITARAIKWARKAFNLAGLPN
ncbi:VC0807 family protein [Nocardia sp. NPDC020380]|uniref:VC0807 family protein n=1 Tax=Nocardia sp. NPDC020380 TaxID=3364309 RepID=UPI003790F93F